MQRQQQQNNFRGAPRGRGQSGGNRRAARDAQRAYQHYNDRQQLENWAYEPAPYDPGREVVNRQPTQRSQNWKNKRQEKKEDKKEEQTVLPKTEYSGARDETLYNIGPHSSLIPDMDCYSQNFVFSGFIPLVNQTYEKMRGVDPRLHDRLPLSMYTHAMATHLNLEILEVARQAGQNVLNLRTDAREVLPDYQVVPQAIADYISHVTDAITQDGKEVRLNLPNIAIPQGPVLAENIQVAPSGTFGILNAQSHNVYECYVSPYVTSARVLASQQQEADYEPLPAELIAGNLVPNRNLLGFEPIDVDNHGARARLQGINFPNDDTLEGRYRYSPLLQIRVYTVLAEIKDRIKMVELKRENNPQGLNNLEKIKKKVTAVNLTFVECIRPVNDAVIPLAERTVNVHSFGAQGSAVSNQSNIECFHRRRIVQGAHMARGFCCLTEAGQGPGGWAATCNDNFNMVGLFLPVLHQYYQHIRMSHFTSRGPAGNRLNAIANFIERNYYYYIRKYLKFPQTQEERQIIINGFYNKFGFPGVLACVDGTHVALVRPSEHEERFFNRKHYHSRNVQIIICDSDLNILNVDATFGGASHDAYIWRQCEVNHHIQQLHNNGETLWLLGDSGYPLRPWLLTPIVNADPGTPEEHYTNVHLVLGTVLNDA